MSKSEIKKEVKKEEAKKEVIEQELKKTTPKPGRFIYCGPNIPGGVLQRYTVFKGGFPTHLADIFVKCPAVKMLFVPVQDLARAEKAITTKGTPEYVHFQEVTNVMRGGV